MNCPHGDDKEECVQCYWESRVGWELERTTLRDQFAMAALTGLCVGAFDSDCSTHASIAYEFADDMLEARKVKP